MSSLEELVHIHSALQARLGLAEKYIKRSQLSFAIVSIVQIALSAAYVSYYISEGDHAKIANLEVMIVSGIALGALGVLISFGGGTITTMVFVMFAICQIVTLLIRFEVATYPLVLISNLLMLGTAIFVASLMLWRRQILQAMVIRPQARRPVAQLMPIYRIDLRQARALRQPPPEYREVLKHPDRYPEVFPRSHSEALELKTRL